MQSFALRVGGGGKWISFSKVSFLTMLSLLEKSFLCVCVCFPLHHLSGQQVVNLSTPLGLVRTLATSERTKTLPTSLRLVSWSLFLSHLLQFPKSTWSSPCPLPRLSCWRRSPCCICVHAPTGVYILSPQCSYPDMGSAEVPSSPASFQWWSSSLVSYFVAFKHYPKHGQPCKRV